MKICNYCGNTSEDGVEVCPSCGSSDFSTRCNQCGTVFSSPYCPQCGLRAGVKSKTCPRCGGEYFTKACPQCGYTTGQGIYSRTNAPYPEKVSSRPKSSVSRKVTPTPPAKPHRFGITFLWILGWIFLFPLPLTILIRRNEKIQASRSLRALSTAVLVVLWVVFLMAAWGQYLVDHPR